MTQKLSVARILGRIKYRPKSILIHSQGPAVANEFFPDPFSAWGHGRAGVELREPERLLRLRMLGDLVELTSDPLIDPDGDFGILSEANERYAEAVHTGVFATRVELNIAFLTEYSSFQELFPVFRGNTLRHERSWVQISPYSIRDVGFTNVEYGEEGDGLNLTTGILKPNQVEELFAEVDYGEQAAAPELDAEEGGLLLQFVRYREFDGPSRDVAKILHAWFDELEATARQMSRDLLRG